jgi:hypothetical protein
VSVYQNLGVRLGSISAVLELDAKQFATLPSGAQHYDVTPDPESCSGHDESGILRDRMRHML